MVVYITSNDGKILVGDRMALEMNSGSDPEPGSCEICFASGERGQIHCTAPFLDSPPFRFSLKDQPIGELRMARTADPNGHFRVKKAVYQIESRGPWTILVQAENEIARLTPAWRDSQVSQGVLAEVTLTDECNDWALAALAFAWVTAEARAGSIAAVSLATMIGVMSST